MKLHKTLFLLFFLLSVSLNAQERLFESGKWGKVGLAFSSFGQNDVFTFQDLVGAPSYDSDYFYTLGVTYVHPINGWLDAETGVEYSTHSIVIHPNLPPDMDRSPRKEKFNLITVPLTLRANFWKYFFVNGGLILDFGGSKSPIDDQTGLGGLLGVALKYDFASGFSVFANPYSKIHALIPFTSNNYQERIWENGVRVGVTYDLSKLK